jgi:hypothetical protein
MPRYVDRPLPSDFEVPAIVPRKVKVMPRKPKGAIAKITRDLKEGIIEAPDQCIAQARARASERAKTSDLVAMAAVDRLRLKPLRPCKIEVTGTPKDFA